MLKISRIILICTSLLLSCTYFLPLWHIFLDAPQYPEGLGISIYISEMTGANKGDLQKINNLNHYIGMKRIEPDAIKELVIMPWIMRALMVMGIVVGASGRRKWLLVWLIVFLVVAVSGFVDYYLWGYDYGHNLDQEHAIIKIPGTSYQPPLIGSKQILNFRALSVPGLGGWIAIIVFLIGTGIWLLEHLHARRRSGR